MECYLFGFDLFVFDIDFVFIENNGNIFVYFVEIMVLCWNVFVCEMCCDVKYNYSILVMDVVKKKLVLYI